MALFNLTSGADVFPGNGVDTRGDDEIHGLEGADNIASGYGADVVHGGLGADLVKAGSGDDVVHGDEGADTLYGGDGKDLLNGGADNDILWGQDGDDKLNGGDGDDIMYGGAGADTYDGGFGYDTVSMRYATGGVFVNATEFGVSMPDMPPSESDFDTYQSIEKFLLSNFNDVFWGDGATVMAYGGADTLQGFGATDIFYGGDGDDTLRGDQGDDKLFGDAGDDTIDAGAGADIVYGGAGTDVIHGGDDADRLFLNAGEAYGEAGDDVVSAQGAGTVLAFGGDGNDRLYGSSDAASFDRLDGGAGADLLNAGAGGADLFGGDDNDRLYTEGDGAVEGEGGDDFLQGDATGATWQLFYGGDGYDTVSYRNAGGAVSVTGDRNANTGAAAQDTYDSVEKFVLGDFNDSYDGSLIGWYGDAIEVRAQDGHDMLFGGDAFETFFGGDGADSLSAQAGDDKLYGGTGQDVLDGGDGDDLVDGGGGGTDLLTGGAGSDTFKVKIGYGVTDIADFVYGVDSFDLDVFAAAGQNWQVLNQGTHQLVTFDSGDQIRVYGGAADWQVDEAVYEAMYGVIPPMEPLDDAPTLSGVTGQGGGRAFLFDHGEWLLGA